MAAGRQQKPWGLASTENMCFGINRSHVGVGLNDCSQIGQIQMKGPALQLEPRCRDLYNIHPWTISVKILQTQQNRICLSKAARRDRLGTPNPTSLSNPCRVPCVPLVYLASAQRAPINRKGSLLRVPRRVLTYADGAAARATTPSNWTPSSCQPLELAP